MEWVDCTRYAVGCKRTAIFSVGTDFLHLKVDSMSMRDILRQTTLGCADGTRAVQSSSKLSWAYSCTLLHFYEGSSLQILIWLTGMVCGTTQ